MGGAHALFILELSQTEENDVAHPDPDALPQLATNVAEPVDTVEAEGLQSAVAKHARNLGVLCGNEPDEGTHPPGG